MKRTLFSCCFLLTALAIPMFSGRHVRAESNCESPQTYADTYGECFWEEDDCDRVADESDYGQVARIESVLVRDDIECYDETKTDYWYDGESDSYYYYEFSDDEATVDEIADETVDALSDPLDELFDICETETVDAPIETEPVVAAEAVVTDEADTYGYDDQYNYGYDSYDDYSYDYDEADADWANLEDGSDYCDESSVVEVCQEDVSVVAETVADETENTVAEADASDAWQDEAYDYYSEYEDYGYDYEEYEYHYGEDGDYAYESTDSVDWDTVSEQSVDEPAVAEEAVSDEPVDEVVEDAWQGDYYSDYEEYYSEYDDYDWADDQEAPATEAVVETVVETVEQAEPVEEVAEPADEVAEDVQPWKYNEYDYGYDAYPYDDQYHAYEYDYEYWDETEAEVEVTEADANLPAVVDEPPVAEPVVDNSRELPRAAVLSLAHTLSRIGSTLQSISEHITEMVDEEVAQQPSTETIER